MRTPLTQEVVERLEQHDAFLHACLGIIRHIPEFDHWLVRFVEPAKSPLPEAPQAEDLLNVALGAVALRLQLGVLLERLTAEPRRSAEPEDEASPLAAREILR